MEAQETQQEETQQIEVPSQQLLDAILNLVINAVHQIMYERQVALPEAKEAVAKYLEKIADELRQEI